MIHGHSIDGATGRSVRKLSMVCLHNNAFVARCVTTIRLHCGIHELHLSALYIISSVATSLRYNTTVSSAREKDCAH